MNCSGSYCRDDEGQRLDERLVRDAELVVAAAEQHRRALGVREAGDLGGEAGLADAGLAGEQRERAVAVRRRRATSRDEHLELGLPTDERDPGADGERRREGRAVPEVAGGRLPLDAQRGHRVGEALEVEGPDVGEPLGGPGTRDEAHDRAAEDLVAPGGRAQAGRLHHGGAVEVAVLVPAVTEAQPDPHVDLVVEVLVPGEHGLLHRHRAGQALGRAEEGRHGAVAHRLDQPAVVGLDGPADQLVVLPLEHVGRVVADPGAQRRRVDQVGEHDRVGRVGGPFHGAERSGVAKPP